MKTMITIMTMVVFTHVISQSQPRFAETKIRTSAICGECKERIEQSLNYSKGVIFAELDLDTKIVTVKYKTKLLTELQVKELIAKIGYKAGDLERDLEAFKKLPKCCQEPGFCKE